MARAPCSLAKFHQQTVHHLDGDVLHVGGDLLYEPRPLDRGEPGLLAPVGPDGHDDVVEDLARPPDHVEVARGYGVEATGTHSHDHCQL